MILEARNIKKTYEQGGEVSIILDGISFFIKTNEIISINGPSGSGKTTLLNILGLIDCPNSGTICYNNVDVNDLNQDELRSNYLGFLFQNHYLIPQLSVYENILLPTLTKSSNIDIEKDDILNLLRMFDLQKLENRYPSDLSGGEKQRIAFIRAIINKPRIVIADEPTGNLDEYNTANLIDIIEEYNKKYHTSFIIATHDNLITKKSNRMIYIERGKLIQTEM